MAQRIVSIPFYLCKKCKKREVGMNGEGLCDVCKSLEEKPKKKLDLKQFGDSFKKAMSGVNQASKKLDEDLKKALGEYY